MPFLVEKLCFIAWNLWLSPIVSNIHHCDITFNIQVLENHFCSIEMKGKMGTKSCLHSFKLNFDKNVPKSSNYNSKIAQSLALIFWHNIVGMT